MVGAVLFAVVPFSPQADSLWIYTVAFQTDTPGMLIIPQNPIFIYNNFV
jgi:hypothetical protein